MRHLCGGEQFAAVVGLAGVGKSTMLSVAREAWEGRGRRMLGAAPAGKAAEKGRGRSGDRHRPPHPLRAKGPLRVYNGDSKQWLCRLKRSTAT
jgi:hypothetical protein